MGYRYQVVTNAGNDVVQVKGTYTLVATGGELGNGFGVEFPVARKSVSSVTGGTLEAGQTKAVVILFENMRNEMTYWNTVVGSTTSSAKTYNISFDVATGTSLKTFGLNAYNPFIWNFGIAATRGREMHLPGHTPTDLADTKLFGTADDSTVASAGRYYLTKTGLPYALDVPAVFEYPAEKVDITQAYLNFAAWAQSGNTTYTDWYSNTGTGYRNTKNIYK
jgi:LruC domain-containing protein